jgi:hypothetical protein
LRLVAEEVGRGVLHDFEGLDLAGVLNVRATAKINQIAVAVNGAILAHDQFFDVVQLNIELAQSTGITPAP